MTNNLVLVTGASGYIATHVVQQLQNAGYRVRVTVRSLSNETKIAPLKLLAPEAKHELELVEADLSKDEGWEKAVSGCWAVVHMASPVVTLAVQRRLEEFVGPAKEGTLRVLQAAADAGVTKVVVTSSFAAVYGESVGAGDREYNEDFWTDPVSPTLDAYTISKVLAEKAAWDFIGNLPEDKQMSLTVINPTLVMGPPLMAAHKDCGSVSLIKVVMASVVPGHPRICPAFCDVRDVARAHLKALTVPEAAGKRFIVNTRSAWMKEVATILRDEFSPQGYSVYTNYLPYLFYYVGSLFNNTLKTTLLSRIDEPILADNTRMVEVLGIEPTKLEESLVDMVYAMVDVGILHKTKNFKQVGLHPLLTQQQEDETKETQRRTSETQQDGN